ncbi:MAG: peptidylprolyl isomerase [Bacillota bacterium]|jgi:parvulin-like peptidyl-prolyl isomerase
MPRRKVISLFLVLIFIAVFSAGCGGDASVIARVNGEKILQNQLEDRIALIKSGLASQGYSLQEGQDDELLGQIEDEAMNQLIDEALLMQQANKEGVSVSNDVVQEQIRLMKKQFGTEVFKQLLNQQKLTEDKLAEQIKVQLTAEALFNKVTSDISVDSETLKATYEENPAKYEQAKVAHILIAVDENAPEEKVKAAREKAQNLISKLNNGEDFAEVAKNNSEDAQSAENGGVIDYYFTREDTSLVKEFVDGAFQVEVGQISKEPVRSPYGFHIIKMLDKKDTFEELEASLEGQLLNEQKNEAFSDFFNKAKSEAKIENLK